MFSQKFRERLARQKYTTWAPDLTEAQLEGLLWAVGELGCRAMFIEHYLDLEAKRNPHGEWRCIHPRARVALKLVQEYSYGRRLTLRQVLARVRRPLIDSIRRQMRERDKQGARTAPASLPKHAVRRRKK